MKKNRKINLIVSGCLFLIYVITAVLQYFVFDTFSWFALFETAGTLIALTILFSWAENVYYLGAVFFAMVAQFGGVMLSLYTIIPIYDIILHLCSGILLTFAGHYLFEIILSGKKKYDIPRCIGICFSTFAAIASAAVWEIYEFSADRIFGLHCQLNSLVDTMGDIIAGTSGAIIGTVLLFFFVKKTIGKSYQKGISDAQ